MSTAMPAVPVSSKLGEMRDVCKACGHPYDHHIFGGMCRDCDCRRCVYLRPRSGQGEAL